MKITTAYPAGIIGNTKANLEAAADGEKMEWSKIYADFEQIARKEGFTEIATSFKEIAEVEEFHEGPTVSWLQTLQKARSSRRKPL